MKQTTKDILIGVMASLITAALIAVFAYLWLIRENQLRIQVLQRDMDRLSVQVENGTNSLNAVKLFVVSAHPDKNTPALSSAVKLQELGFRATVALAASMDKYPTATAFAEGVLNDNPHIAKSVTTHQIGPNDLRNYWLIGKDHGPNDNRRYGPVPKEH